MYESFFGLTVRPFELVPDPRFLFLSDHQQEALSNLQFGLSTPRGLTLLLGEAGTGKTTLLEAALSRLDPDRVQCVLVSNPTLTRTEFYEHLAAAFGLNEDARSSKTHFLFGLRKHLVGRSSLGQVTALILDEAQSLPDELLEEVRLLGNIETQTTKLLNVVLSGQPELSDRLNDGARRQLKQRISLRCELRAFNLNETASYIAGRVRIAGGDPAKVFSREAVLAIHEASGGIARTVNVICDNALIGAFAAQTKPVLRSLVEEICRDFDLVTAQRPEPVQAANPEQDSDQAAVARDVIDRPEPSITPMFASVTNRRRFVFF